MRFPTNYEPKSNNDPNLSSNIWTLDFQISATNISVILYVFQVPLFVLAPMTVIYVTLFLTGVVGNVATGVVIVRNRSMHTATNYYLFSLALSDLVILLLGE